MPLYADIVLPLAQPEYTFAVPEEMTVEKGCAVAVQFGRQKFYTGIVWRLHDRRPDVKTVKPIQALLYERPLLSERQMQFWEWLADYYMSTLGEVMRVALPSLMKPSADSRSGFEEELFRPRRELYFLLSPSFAERERLDEVLDHLERRAPRQYDALLEVITAAQPDALNSDTLSPQIFATEIPRRLLTAELPVLRALEKKEYLLAVEHEPSTEQGEVRFRLPSLTPHQEEAREEIRRQFDEGKAAVLLQGITSSGKTEVYIHLIAEVLSRGGDVLLLVPEIALTAQLIERMERIFGSRVTPYHSKLSDVKRSETYLRLNRSRGGSFVVGVRSSVFLPLHHLQLIIVDEEHDPSYKQADPAPRYQARDCAVMAARIFSSKTLLGSATPSLETWLNATGGKYGHACLTERYGQGRLPQILISDTLRAARRGERHSHFNQLLLDKIEAALSRGEQVMLFQNRRGFSPFVECTECGWTARCKDCNVSLTYHKASGRLVCHYCGHSEPMPHKCPSCKVTDLVPMGFGTEKIEEEILRFFPTARVARLDRDAVTSERAFNTIINDFAEHRTDILVGTQMITKGFDFDGVSLVGILNADNLLSNPDFRASERAFQLMMQVAGRAGRRAAGGEVVIQTSDPRNPVLRQIIGGDYEGMALSQLKEREEFFYPPYSRIIAFTLRHRDIQLLRRAAVDLSGRLRKIFGRRLMGPMSPPVDRIRGEYLIGMLLKIESGASARRAREIIRHEMQRFHAVGEYKYIEILINVDPQ